MKLIYKLNRLIAKYVSIIIFSGILVGLSTDILGFVSKEILAFVLFLELFVACFKIKKEDVVKINPKAVSILIVFRYFFFPIIAYFSGLLISSELAIVLLLLSLLPAGVTSPGFAGIFNANIALTLSVVLITGILSPFYIPFIIKSVAGSSIEISSLAMLKTIFYLVVCPMVLHIPFRKLNKFHNTMVEYNPLLIIPMAWFTIVVPISKYRNYILDDYFQSILMILGFLALYLIYAYLRKFFASKQKNICKKSYMVVSSIHNITLGVILALIYFPSEVSSLVILANVSAVIMISLLKGILKRQ